MTNEELVKEIQAGNNVKENTTKLWEQCSKFVTMVAKRYINHADLEDLEQEGFLGLMEGVRHFDASQGTKLLSYASHWIEQAIRRYIMNCCNSVRVPIHAYESIGKYKRFVHSFVQEYDREPTEKETSYYLGISLGNVRQLKKDASMTQINSLNKVNEDNLALMEIVKDPSDYEGDAIRHLDHLKLQENIGEILENLEGQQSDAIRLRYFEGKTLKEAEQEMGVSLDRVRIVQQKALKTLRLRKHSDKLRPYYNEYLQGIAYRHVGVSTFQRTGTSIVERVALEL